MIRSQVDQSFPRRRLVVLPHVIRISGLIAWLVLMWLERRGNLSQTLAIALGTVITIAVLVAVWDLTRLLKTEAKIRHALQDLSTRHEKMLDTSRSLDASARHEIALWLHGTVQGELLSISRAQNDYIDSIVHQVRERLEVSAIQRDDLIFVEDCLHRISQRLSEDFERFIDQTIRRKSHSFFPPLLATSLQFALLDLLHGRAELQMDERLMVTREAPSQKFGDEAESKTVQLKIRELIRGRIFLGPETRYRIYRVVEEAVTNAQKSGATRILVNIRVEGESLRITVVNNGAPVNDSFERSVGLLMVEALTTPGGGGWSLQNTPSGVEFCAHIFPPPSDTRIFTELEGVVPILAVANSELDKVSHES